jgi:hypothetical protein
MHHSLADGNRQILCVGQRLLDLLQFIALEMRAFDAEQRVALADAVIGLAHDFEYFPECLSGQVRFTTLEVQRP